jgi:hypothetical protein
VSNLGIYIPPALQHRIQSLKEKGVSVPVSAICQRALEAALDAEERALSGDRLARVVARLKSTKTLGEAWMADGEAAGRRWAEDVARLAELQSVRSVLECIEAEHLQVAEVQTGRHNGRINLVRIRADGTVDSRPPAHLPGNVPRELFERAGTAHDGIVYIDHATKGFLRGASAVLDAVEQALAMESHSGPGIGAGATNTDLTIATIDVDPNDIPF